MMNLYCKHASIEVLTQWYNSTIRVFSGGFAERSARFDTLRSSIQNCIT